MAPYISYIIHLVCHQLSLDLLCVNVTCLVSKCHMFGFYIILPPFLNICLFRDFNKWLRTEKNEWIYTLKYVYIRPYVVVHLKYLKRQIFRNGGSIWELCNAMFFGQLSYMWIMHHHVARHHICELSHAIFFSLRIPFVDNLCILNYSSCVLAIWASYEKIRSENKVFGAGNGTCWSIYLDCYK
mgnify:CR=1 FL=1